jgi:uncharacterized protein (UPF0333 family)
MGSWFCIWDDLANPKNGLNLIPNPLQYQDVIAHFMKHVKKIEKVEIVWDSKSTIRLIQIVMLLSFSILGAYFIPGFFRDRKTNELNGISSGIVVKIEPKSISTQGFYGQKESIYSYELTFVYTVDSKTYTNTNDIPTTGKYFRLISIIRKSNYTKKVDINYNEINPQESLIIIE